MDAPIPPPEPAPSAPDVVTAPCNCIICGTSLLGLPTSGNCPNCTTPVALSLPKVEAEAAPAMVGLVKGDRLCVKCGKNLKGLPLEGFCPECRTPIAQSAAVTVARGKMVADDRPCLVCGYNLKGVDSAGNCPECGTPVARSLRGFLLKYSSREYLAMLRRGILLVEVTLGLSIVFGLCIFIYAMAFSILRIKGVAASGATPTIGGPGTPTGAAAIGAKMGMGLAYQAIQQISAMILKWMSVLGMWMFTTQDPGLTTQDPGNKSRRLLRLFLTISAVIAMASSIIVFLPQMQAQLVGAAGGVPGIPVITFALVVGFLGGAAQLVGVIATMNYMAMLARRIPDAPIEERAKRYRWLLPVVYVAGFVVCGIGPLAAFIMYILLIDDWRKRLNTLEKAVLQEDVDFAAAH